MGQLRPVAKFEDQDKMRKLIRQPYFVIFGVAA
jgi:hypothetical protein